MGKKVCIVGGVAGGASCATRLRRLDEGVEIVLFERGPYVSFANCGLPYHLSEVIPERDSLLVASPELLRKRFRIDLRLHHEVAGIDRQSSEIEVRNLDSGETYRESYDNLVLAPGSASFKPPIPGIDSAGVFTMRTIPDLDAIIAWLGRKTAHRVVVIGGGYIGLEAAENFRQRGLEVAVVEAAPQAMTSLDPEMAVIVQAHIKEQGVELYLGEKVQEIREGSGGLVVQTDKRELPTDLVLVAVGARPETILASRAGLTLGVTGGIKVDQYLRTSDPAIYAVGDAIEVKHFVNEQPVLLPLAGPANRQGRLVADNISGRLSPYRDTQGTAIFKMFDLTAASTGLNSANLERSGQAYKSVIVHPFAHATYYPGGTQMALKLIFSPDDGRILGAQAVGREGIDKRIDVLATAMRGRMTVYDLEHLELCYAPPYSTAKDAVNIAGFAASNIMRGDVKVVSFDELPAIREGGGLIIDVRTPPEVAKGAIPGAINIPLDQLRDRLDEVPRDRQVVVHCQVGQRSYNAYRILKGAGFENVYNLSGGYKTYQYMK
jgi:NADPH-dependent 2,4-dienoyl-CoA reductase/sulfur reductase-like enzyme/rhodanese-related sulfurtransferase